MNIQILITALLFLSCTSSIGNYSQIKIYIPESMTISQSDIKSILPPHRNKNVSNNILDITIYYFSPGGEILKYSEENAFSYGIKNGKIKALLKFRSNNKLKKVIFICATGKNRDEILKNFSIKLNDVLLDR